MKLEKIWQSIRKSLKFRQAEIKKTSIQNSKNLAEEREKKPLEKSQREAFDLEGLKENIIRFDAGRKKFLA